MTERLTLGYRRAPGSAEAALDLYRNGARVTLVHRDGHLGQSIKYWVKPDIENRIKAGQIQALFETRVMEITPQEAIVSNHGGEKRLPAKQVFALTGYHPDFAFIEKLGVPIRWRATFRGFTWRAW